MITQEELEGMFSYDADTGYLTNRLTRRGVTKGSRAGTLHPSGYRQIKIDYKAYQEHRLIWLFTHGEFPPDCIDHINGISDDNRICNLREATISQN